MTPKDFLDPKIITMAVCTLVLVTAMVYSATTVSDSQHRSESAPEWAQDIASQLCQKGGKIGYIAGSSTYLQTIYPGKDSVKALPDGFLCGKTYIPYERYTNATINN